ENQKFKNYWWFFVDSFDSPENQKSPQRTTSAITCSKSRYFTSRRKSKELRTTRIIKKVQHQENRKSPQRTTKPLQVLIQNHRDNRKSPLPGELKESTTGIIEKSPTPRESRV
ncbi:12306_t:CDS:2, partial [Gigaspora rosea]